MPVMALFNRWRRVTPTEQTERALLLDDASLDYRLTRARRRTIAIHVSRNGVEVRAPTRVSLAEIEAFMRRKARWIRRKLSDSAPAEPFCWASGSELGILGEKVCLVAAPGQKGIVRDGGWLRIGDVGRRRLHKHPSMPTPESPERPDGPATNDALAAAWRKAVVAWLRDQALAHFTARATEFAGKLSVPMPELKLSNASSRWGCCIRRGREFRVLLHWKLYLLPPHLIDYVVVHELAHIRELNHSPRFWAEVARLFPGAAAARRELRVLGRRIPQL